MSEEQKKVLALRFRILSDGAMRTEQSEAARILGLSARRIKAVEDEAIMQIELLSSYGILAETTDGDSE